MIKDHRAGVFISAFVLFLWITVGLITPSSGEQTVKEADGSKNGSSEKKEKIEHHEVIVTVARVEEMLKETPATVNVFPKKEMEKVKYRNASEVLKRRPGIYTHSFHGEEELTSIRIPTHFVNPYVLLLVDGLPATGYGEGAGAIMREINSQDVESMEITKGPASALYGSNAIGGVINVITKRPSSKPDYRAWGEYGQYERFRGGFSAGGTINALGLYMDLNGIKTDGWREQSGQEKAAAAAKLYYAPGGDSMLTLKLDIIHQDNELSGSLDKTDFEEDWRQSYNTFTSVKLDKIIPSVTYKTRLADGDFKVSALFRLLDNEVNPNYGIRYDPRTRQYTSYLSDTNSKDLDLQALYARTFDPYNSRLIAGLDFERTVADIKTYDLTVVRDPATKKYTEFTNQGLGESYDLATTMAAPYFQYEATFFGKARINVGGRFDWIEFDVVDELGGGNEGIHDFSRFSPKAGAIWDAARTFNLYGSYSRGFVAPTVSQLFTGRGAVLDLNPELASNLEAGYRSLFWNDRISHDLAVYAMTIEGKIINQTIDPVTGAFEYANVGETSHRGVETTFDIKLHPAFSFAASYTYARNRYEDYRDPLKDIDYDGNWMPRAPKHRMNARFNLTPVDKLNIEVEMDAESRQFADDANEYAYDRPVLFSLRGTYRLNGLSLWCHILNITDRKYATYVNASYGKETYYSGDPLTAYVGLEYRWGADR
ncbi:TonB-dependent receptor [Acidobacteriota bacterium]